MINEFKGIILKKDEVIEREAKTTIPGLIFTWVSIPGGFFLYWLIVYFPVWVKSTLSSAFKREMMEAIGLESGQKINLTDYIFRNIEIPEFLVFLIKIPFIMLIIAWLIWCLVMTSRHFKYSLAVTNLRVIGKSGAEMFDSPLNEIKNVYIEQSIWGKMLNFGDIVVSSKKGSMTFKNIHDPHPLHKLIMSYASDYAAH